MFSVVNAFLQNENMTTAITPTRPTLLSLARGDTPARDAQRLAEQDLFASVLGSARGEETQSLETQARRAAEEFVAQSLVQPVLKQMREQGNAAAPFAPNQAEKAFRTMLDSAISQSIVRSGHWSLVDKVAARILQRGGSLPSGGPSIAPMQGLEARP